MFYPKKAKVEKKTRFCFQKSQKLKNESLEQKYFFFKFEEKIFTLILLFILS